jgi:hypothetical protein
MAITEAEKEIEKNGASMQALFINPSVTSSLIFHGSKTL